MNFIIIKISRALSRASPSIDRTTSKLVATGLYNHWWFDGFIQTSLQIIGILRNHSTKFIIIYKDELRTRGEIQITSITSRWSHRTSRKSTIQAKSYSWGNFMWSVPRVTLGKILRDFSQELPLGQFYATCYSRKTPINSLLPITLYGENLRELADDLWPHVKSPQ